MAEAKEMPWHVVHELQRASEAVPCAPSGQRWPVIRLSMTLEAASDKPEETKGNLVFKVWLLPSQHCIFACVSCLLVAFDMPTWLKLLLMLLCLLIELEASAVLAHGQEACLT
jgi:hypothetical protein